MKNKIVIVLIGIALFTFRLLMGFSKFYSHDEFQIYLIGLKSFTSQTYPYFGPDVVYTKSQIPGGLQGLLISGPLQLFACPESPYILLNLLSFAGLVFFGWYLSKRLPSVPKWFIYIWLLTCPWTVQFSTHIENPSYVLFGSILFFIAVFELGHFYDKPLIHNNISFFFIGFSIFWIMQLHMSWVLMIPIFLWLIFINRRKTKLLLRGSLFFLLGSLISASTLIPTILLNTAEGSGAEKNIIFNPSNFLEIPNIFLRYLSFVSYEVPKYLGNSFDSRLEFITNNIWISPIIITLLLLGLFQVIYFSISYFKPNDYKEWNKVKRFVLLSFLLLCCSFLFSVSKPKAYTFYIFFPIIMWYSIYCYTNLFKKNIQKLAILLLIFGVIFQLSLFSARYSKNSLFAHREKVIQAIESKDYTTLGIRRESQFINANTEKTWKKSTSNNQETWYANFEYNSAYFTPQNVVRSEKFNGKSSCKIDNLQPFSINFNKTLTALKGPNKISISFMAKCTDFSQYLLVYRTSDENWEKIDYQQMESSSINDWIQFDYEYNIPKSPYNTADFSFYFWMNGKGKSQLFVDDLKLILI